MAYDVAIARGFLKRRVVLTLTDDREIYCVVQMAGPNGILVVSEFGTDLWEARFISELRLQKPPAVKTKAVALINTATIRQHLADRHGIWVEVVNEMDETQAVDSHAKLSHKSLSHYHAPTPPPVTEKKEAIAVDPDQLELDL